MYFIMDKFFSKPYNPRRIHATAEPTVQGAKFVFGAMT